MTVTINHTTPADGTFSTQGAAAWDAAHAVTGLGTLAEQNANAAAITGGSVDGTTIGASTASTGKFTTLESTGTASLGTASAQYIQNVGDATYPQVKAAGSGTNIPLVLQPKGTGALQSQLTDSTATGGNARGANAVDWQTARDTAAKVASGQYAFIGGGYGNISSQFTSAIGGGYTNISSSTGTTVSGGSTNTASSPFSAITGGELNTAAGYFNFIGGGFTNSGTSGSAVTTQATTTVTSGSTAVTLSGSNANIKVGQYITGTGIAAETYVAAISGTSLTLSKNANATGTPTLSFYTPHGVVVGGGNNQATGSYSFIGGGGDAGTAANRNTASGDWSAVVGGRANSVVGIGDFIGGGRFNTTTGGAVSDAVICGGNANTASAYASAILGGAVHTATGPYSTILGGVRGTTRGISGYVATPASVSPVAAAIGASQAGLLILGIQTTDATATVLTSTGTAAGTTNQVILPNNSAYFFTAKVIAGVTGGGNTSAWKLEGAIKRGATAGSTAIVGAVVTTLLAQDVGAATWAVTATADTTNGGLKITVTGQAATTIRWVCKVETTELTY